MFILLPKLNFSASNPDLGNKSLDELEAELSIPASVGQQAVQIQFFTATTKAKFEDKLSVFEIEENEDSLSGKKQVVYGAFLLLLFTVIANDLLLRDVFIAVNNRSNSLFTGKSHFISICSLRI